MVDCRVSVMHYNRLSVRLKCLYTVNQGCTTYFTDSARNISGREVRGRRRSLGVCTQWGPGAKPLVRGSGAQSPPEADDGLLIQQQNFCAHTCSYVYAEIEV